MTKAIPKVIAVKRGNHLIIKCPLCCKIHTHGLPYGHRISHCENHKNRGTYILVPENISATVDDV